MRNKILIALSIGFMISIGTLSAQQSNTADSDVEAVLGYNPQEVLDDWKNWEQNQPEEFEFLSQYMIDYNVPQVGLYGLNLHDTWYWWISNNANAIEDYFELKDQE